MSNLKAIKINGIRFSLDTVERYRCGLIRYESLPSMILEDQKDRPKPKLLDKPFWRLFIWFKKYNKDIYSPPSTFDLTKLQALRVMSYLDNSFNVNAEDFKPSEEDLEGTL